MWRPLTILVVRRAKSLTDLLEPSVDDVEGQKLLRENAYLKLRCAQLQDDVTDISSQLARSQQALERVHGARAALALKEQ